MTSNLFIRTFVLQLTTTVMLVPSVTAGTSSPETPHAEWSATTETPAGSPEAVADFEAAAAAEQGHRSPGWATLRDTHELAIELGTGLVYSPSRADLVIDPAADPATLAARVGARILPDGRWLMNEEVVVKPRLARAYINVPELPDVARTEARLPIVDPSKTESLLGPNIGDWRLRSWRKCAQEKSCPGCVGTWDWTTASWTEVKFTLCSSCMVWEQYRYTCCNIRIYSASSCKGTLLAYAKGNKNWVCAGGCL